MGLLGYTGSRVGQEWSREVDPFLGSHWRERQRGGMFPTSCMTVWLEKLDQPLRPHGCGACGDTSRLVSCSSRSTGFWDWWHSSVGCTKTLLLLFPCPGLFSCVSSSILGLKWICLASSVGKLFQPLPSFELGLVFPNALSRGTSLCGSCFYSGIREPMESGRLVGIFLGLFRLFHERSTCRCYQLIPKYLIQWNV